MSSRGGRKFENATINGTQAALFDIRDVGVDARASFTKDEEVSGAQVVVVGRGDRRRAVPRRRSARPGGAHRRTRLPRSSASRHSRARPGASRSTATCGCRSRRSSGRSADGEPAGVREGERRRGAERAAEDHARISMRARRHLGPGAADTFDLITREASRSLVTAITERLGAAGPPISLMALHRRDRRRHQHDAGVSDAAHARDRHPPGDRRLARERAGRDAGGIERDRAGRRRDRSGRGRRRAVDSRQRALGDPARRSSGRRRSAASSPPEAERASSRAGIRPAEPRRST